MPRPAGRRASAPTGSGSAAAGRRIARPEAQALRRVGLRRIDRPVARRRFLDARQRGLQQGGEGAEIGLLARQRPLEPAEALLQPPYLLLTAVELHLAVVEHAEAAASPLAVVLGRIALDLLVAPPRAALAIALEVGLDLVQLLLAAAELRDLAIELAHVALERALAIGLVILGLGELVAAPAHRVGEQAHFGLAALELACPLLVLAHPGGTLADARLGGGQLGRAHGEVGLERLELGALGLDSRGGV